MLDEVEQQSTLHNQRRICDVSILCCAVGTQARLMSQALRKLTANASKCNCTILFLNQLRHKVGVVYGNPEITSGGQALKFYASVRLEVRRKQTVEDSAGVGIGIKVKAKVSTLQKALVCTSELLMQPRAGLLCIRCPVTCPSFRCNFDACLFRC